MFKEPPRFEAGETRGVLEHVLDIFPEFCDRLDVPHSARFSLCRLATQSLQISIGAMTGSLSLGLVEYDPVVRGFSNMVGHYLVSGDSRMFGVAHLQTALDAMSGGMNVLLVQNHRSGADTMLMEILIDRHFGSDEVFSKWAYVSGHAVNLYLIPLMFSLGVRRFQVYSAKYRADGLAGNTDAEMAQQNMRAMRALMTYARSGGKLVGYYPEGGRGDGCMKRGEPKTVCVAQVMQRASSGGDFLILPTYVDGTTNLLPPHRGTYEYNGIFQYAQRGTATLTFGRPLRWSEIQPSAEIVDAVAEEGDKYQRVMVDTMLGLVASLAPCPTQQGPYAEPGLRALVSRFGGQYAS